MGGDPVLAALARLEAKMDGRFGKIDARFGKIDDRFEQLEGGLARVRVDLMDRMDRLDDRMTALHSEMMTSFGKVEDRFTGMRDGSIVNFARADRAIDVSDRNEQELRDMWRAIHRTQTRLDDLGKRK